jgi:uncharacterized membrane protein YtjA (UPF0391 family)
LRNLLITNKYQLNMKKNVGTIDRTIRIIIAIIAAYLAYSGTFGEGWINYVLYAVAAIMLVVAVVGSCPLYCAFGMSTCKTKE